MTYAVRNARPLDQVWREVRDLCRLNPQHEGMSEEELGHEVSKREAEAKIALIDALCRSDSRVYFADARGTHQLYGPNLFGSDQLNRHATLITGEYISFVQPGVGREYLDAKIWLTDEDANLIVRRIEGALRGKSEPPRVCRRRWVVSHAAISMLSAAA